MRTHVSLFAGGGGSSEGVRQAGAFKTLLAIENDGHAVATYRANHPTTPIDDRKIEDVSAEDVLCITGLAPGELDLLDASPPCQPFSRLGKRSRGWDGVIERLSFEALRLVEGLAPRAWWMENVAGLAQDGANAGIFNAIVRRAEAAGYAVRWKVLNAHWFGVPQDRSRLIVVGLRADVGAVPRFPAPLLPAERRSVRDALPHVRWIEDYEFTRPIVRSADRPMPTIAKSRRPHKLRVVGEEEARKPTIDELKALCGFPPGYVIDGTYSQQHARLGNSVPPPMARAIAGAIHDTLPLPSTH